MKVINADAAVEKLEEIRQKKLHCECSRETYRQATALAYAQEVLKRMPEMTAEELTDYLEKIRGE